MLQIDRQDQDQLRKWMAEHEDLFEGSNEEDTARDLAFSDPWLPLFVSFLNGVVLVNKYVGGLTGLLEKSKAALQWLKGGTKEPSELPLGVRILALLMSSGRKRSAGMSVQQIAAITGSPQDEVKSNLKTLDDAGTVARANGLWHLVVQ